MSTRANETETSGGRSGDAAKGPTEGLSAAQAGGVLTLTLDRPAKKNALTSAMYGGLAHALRAADQGRDVGAIVIRGAGGAFTAGNDLGDFARDPGGAGRAAMDFLAALAALETPLVASVDGVAVGIGTTLLLHCDAAIAGPDARFATPFIDLALCPEGASSVLMPARIGRAATTRLLMLGERFDAGAALECGLVDRIAADPAAEAAELAARLAAKPREAMRTTKRLLKAPLAPAVAAALAAEGQAFGERLISPEAQAAFRAFLAR